MMMSKSCPVTDAKGVHDLYFKASERKAFHGLCLVVIQSKREPGTIRLTAKSEGLREAELSIQVK